MPISVDEEETLCLLSAADSQEDSPGPRKPTQELTHAKVGTSGRSSSFENSIENSGSSPGLSGTSSFPNSLSSAPLSYARIVPTLAWEDGNDQRDPSDNSAVDSDTKSFVKLKRQVSPMDAVDASRSTEDGHGRKRKFSGSSASQGCSRSSTPDTFLATRNAERTFFSVCSTGGKYKKVNDGDDEFVDESSIKVVNEILGDLERDELAKVKSQGSSENKENPNNGEGVKGKTSLVVDVHLPPQNKEKQPTKYEMNRFQRCYSDSQHSSPKWKKAKDTKMDNSLQNVDEIETVYEPSHHSGNI